MRNEESNKTKANLVEKDIVLCKKYSWANMMRYYLAKKEQKIISLFVFVLICNGKC